MNESHTLASNIQDEKKQSHHHHHHHLLRTTELRTEATGKISKVLKILVCAFAVNNYGGYVKEKADNTLASYNLPSTNEFTTNMVDTVKDHASTLKSNLAKHVNDEESMKLINEGINDWNKLQNRVALKMKPAMNKLQSEYMKNIHPIVKQKYQELKPIVERSVGDLKALTNDKYEELKPIAQERIASISMFSFTIYTITQQ